MSFNPFYNKQQYNSNSDHRLQSHIYYADVPLFQRTKFNDYNQYNNTTYDNPYHNKPLPHNHSSHDNTAFAIPWYVTYTCDRHTTQYNTSYTMYTY